MINLSLKKVIIALVILVVIGPPIGFYIHHKLYPPSFLYELVYTETLSDEDVETGRRPVVLNFCFDVPSDLNLKGDLQEFMATVTKKDIPNIVMSEVTEITDFTYKAKEGCGETYAVKVEKEDTRTAYELFRNGELR